MCASDHEVEWRSEKKGRRERERADRHGDEVESSDNDDEAESDGDYIEGEVGGGAACDGGRWGRKSEGIERRDKRVRDKVVDYVCALRALEHVSHLCAGVKEVYITGRRTRMEYRHSTDTCRLRTHEVFELIILIFKKIFYQILIGLSTNTQWCL